MLSKKNILRILPALLVLMFAFSQGAQAAPPADFSDLAKDAGPAVVNISTERLVNVPNRPPFPFEFFRGMPGGEDFERFFGPGPDQGQGQTKRRQHSLGSGFIISPDGYVVTNNHVIKGADMVSVNMHDKDGKETSYKAEVVGSDADTDLALLKIKADKPLPILKFGDSDASKVGAWVVAIGNPFGLDHTVTAGILSAKGRNIGSGPFDSYLQTDASINPGNSGGPLLNMDGEVIGINTAIVPQGQGIGFAIPSSMAKKIIEDLKTDKKVSRGWIGVSIQNVDDATAKALGLEKAGGALVGGVIPGQPADKAGLEAGDVITKIDGKDITSSDELLRAIAGSKPGTDIKVTAWRNGGYKEFTVTLADRAKETASANDPSSRGNSKEESAVASLGIDVRTFNKKEADQLKMPNTNGLLVTNVEPGLIADEGGIRRGDVIVAVGRAPVNSIKDFQNKVEEAQKKGVLMLQISRDGQRFIRTLDMTKKVDSSD